MRPMVHSIKGSHICKKSLSCANIAGCFLTLDMSFSSLKGDSEKHFFKSVTWTQSHEPSWHFPNELIRGVWYIFSACYEASMRTSISYGDSKSLCTAHYNISTHISWRFKKSTSERICSYYHIDIMGVGSV